MNLLLGYVIGGAITTAFAYWYLETHPQEPKPPNNAAWLLIFLFHPIFIIVIIWSAIKIKLEQSR